MRLAPIIERYMSLKRQENALYNEFDLMCRNTPLPIEDYGQLFGIFSALFRLLHDTRNSDLSQMYLTRMVDCGAELAAVDRVMAEIAKKTEETRIKSTYSTRPRVVLNFSESTIMALTSSVMEIARTKKEIKVLLRQM